MSDEGIRCVRQQVDHLKTVLSTSLTSATDQVNALADRGSQFVGYASERLQGVGSTDELTEHVTNVRASLESQREALSKVDQQRQILLQQCARLESLANQTRLLAMNARIETEHIAGKDGGSFAVIANEIKQVAVNVLATTNTVQDVSDELVELLPRIESSTAEAESETDALYQVVSAQQHDGEARAHEIVGVATTVTHEMTQLAQRALADLQCQDVVDQGLDQLERRLMSVLGQEEMARGARTAGMDFEASEDDLVPGQNVSF